jgi:hypothetical protein
VGCNLFKSGNYIEYTRRMIDEVGIEEVDKLREEGKETHPFTEKELEEIIEDFKQKINNMKLTAEAYDRKITIESPHDDMDIYDMWTDFIKPLLLGLTYTEKTVDGLLNEEENSL